MFSKNTKKSINIFIKGVAALVAMLLLISLINFGVPEIHAQSLSESEKAELEAELAELEKEIKAQEAILAGQKNKSQTLTNEIATLRAKINSAKSKINKANLEINSLKNEISDKEDTIEDLSVSIDNGKESLSQLIRKTNEMDKQTFVHAVLTADSISDFYLDIDSFSSIKRQVNNSVNEIQTAKVQTEEVRNVLEEKKNEELDKKAELEKQKSVVEKSEATQKTLLSISKNKEAEYQKIIADRQAEAAQIRAKLFPLRGSAAIPFGQAYEYAKTAGQRTGVRPAYILAILKQESNLGSNVGTCNRPGDARTWRDIMPGPNDNSWRDDQSAFVRITNRLGIPQEGQPLSCPLAWGGWGGAMGPSQFIPVTWESYDGRIESIMGVDVADPWNPEHAITATALYVMDLGANKQTYSAERDAACKYYSGRGCSDPAVKNLFYGNAVMSHASSIQKDIDFLEGN